jgi:two-component system, LytTR family, response regulator
MKQLRAVIVDDEPLARENMRDLLGVHEGVIVVGEAGTVDEARRVLLRERPDAVFLDIRMPGGTGFDVLAGLDLPIQVVFVTAYDEFAIRAFRVNAVDYLLKPLDRDLLAQSVARLIPDASRTFDRQVLEGWSSVPLVMEDEVLACHKTGYALVPVQTICAIRADGNYTEVLATRDQSHLFRRALKEWLDRLPAPPFLSLDRSVIVNAQGICGWQSRGRRLELRFEGLSKTLTLGRAGSVRFRKFLKGRATGME